MCFIIDIDAEGIARDQRGQVSKSFHGSKTRLEAKRQKKKASDHSPYVLAGPDGGCSCALLSDDADWEHETWSLDPECLPECSNAIGHLFESGATELTILPLWAGETAKRSITITREEMQKAFLQNQVFNFVEYRVKGNA